MYVSRVWLENIRGFSGRRNVDLTLTRPDGSHAGWTVLTGPNGSGKTTLLQAIAVALGGPVVAGRLIPDLRPWIAAGAQHGSVRLHLMTAPEDYRPGNGERAKNLTVTVAWDIDPTREKLRPDGQPVMSRYTETDVATNDPPVVAGMGTPSPDDPADWFCAGYGPFRRLTGGSAEAQWLVTTPGPTARMASLFCEGVALTEAVQWLIGMDLRTLEGRDWARDLRTAALQILADGLLPNGCQVADVTSDGLWVASQGRRFPLREMGAGNSGVVALVADLIKQVHDCYGDLHFEVRDGVPVITAPGVVLIDEAEARMDEAGQQQVGPWLKRHFPNMQFIVSTDSPYICQAADPGGLVRMPGLNEGVPPQVVVQDLLDRVHPRAGASTFEAD